jgi:hypothetical protein
MLSIVFLTPLYHSHDHAADYYQENSDDHVLLHDVSVDDSLDTGQQHNGPHLHIKKDIGRTDTYCFKSSSLKPDLCVVTESPVFAEHLSCMLVQYTQTLVFLINSRACLSGLSPPTA